MAYLGHVVGNFARALVRAAAMGASWPLEIFSNADRPEAHMAERVGMFRGQGISTIIKSKPSSPKQQPPSLLFWLSSSDTMDKQTNICMQTITPMVFKIELTFTSVVCDMS